MEFHNGTDGFHPFPFTRGEVFLRVTLNGNENGDLEKRTERTERRQRSVLIGWRLSRPYYLVSLRFAYIKCHGISCSELILLSSHTSFM